MNQKRFQHFIITRFSYRDPAKTGYVSYSRAAGADWGRGNDPLDPENLSFRFFLFELICLPHVLAQSNQDFDWVLIIDRDLPTSKRRQLEDMVSGRARTHLHEASANDDLSRLEWLRDYRQPATDFILTTLLDDDDAIPLAFVEKLHAHINEIGPSVPSLKTFGAKDSLEWDLYVSRRHPFGRLAPWHRYRWFRSAGFSMLCRTAAHGWSVFSLYHTFGDTWFETRTGDVLRHVLDEKWGKGHGQTNETAGKISRFQQQLAQHGGPGGDDWMALSGDQLYYDLSREGIVVVQANHFLNDQGTRLLEHKPGSSRVVGPESFPNGFRFNLELLRDRKDLLALSRQRHQKYVQELRCRRIASPRERHRAQLKLLWWFLRH